MAIVMGLDQHREQVAYDVLDTDTGEVRRRRIRSTVTSGRRRSGRIAVHIYVVPVVRELPSQPAEASNDLTW